MEYAARAVNAVTGWDLDKDDAIHFGKRTAALFKAFNVRCGIGPEVEKPSPRYGSIPHDGPAAGQNVMLHWDLMRRTFYETVGYDPETGVPRAETLQKLGLEEVIPSLWGEAAERKV